MKLAAIFLLALSSAVCAVKTGDTAPAIKIDSLTSGEPVAASLEALKGKAVVLEFWATWCGPCVDAIPHLNQLVDQFAGRPIQFLSVTDEERSLVEEFLKKKPIHGWVGFDRGKVMSKQYGFEGIPDTVLIDVNGKIAGIAHPSMLRAEHLEDLLAGKPVKLPVRPDMSIARVDMDSGAPPLLDVLVRPSTAANSGMSSGPGKFQQKSTTIRNMMSSASGVPAAFVVGDAVDEPTRYDVSVTAPRNEDEAMRKLLPDLLAMALHLKLTRETRDTEGWILTAPQGRPESLKEAASSGGMSRSGRGMFSMTGMGMDQLAKMVQSILGKPVVNKTGITGRFDFSVNYDDTRLESLVEGLRERGFALERTTQPTEFLLVTKK